MIIYLLSRYITSNINIEIYIFLSISIELVNGYCVSHVNGIKKKNPPI